jgi:uncharacterized membrane protein YhaH (DUF805 family)
LPADSLPEAALNPARNDLVELMLSSTGRMSRGAFLACAAVLLGLADAYAYELAPRIGPRLGWIVYPLLLFPTACILSKRLHDRGRAGWWAFVPVWALVEVFPQPSTPLGFVGLAVLAVTLVDLGLLPSKPETNRFGPPAEGRRS